MRASALILVMALAAAITEAAPFQVVVKAKVDSKAAIVSARVPKEFPEAGLLKGEAGQVPFQRVAVNEAVFVLKDLQAGETRTYTAQGEDLPASARAEAVDGRVELSVGKHRVLTYQGRETELPRPDVKPIFKRGGYIHPLFSPSGKVLTDDYPPNHLHHHGIWFPWTKTEFEGRAPDFWNMGEGKGRVEFVQMGSSWSGPVSAGFTAQHRFVDLTSGAPKTALNETWVVRTYDVPGAEYFVFDLVSSQTCASGSELKLPKYLYGGLGFRGNWGWNGEDKCFFLTANGETDRVKGNETRANWCYVGGDVDGGRTGVTIFGHPENFRAPQPMRLHPKEPFFCFAPSQAGDWAIEPGQTYVSRYRFVVKDGEPSKDELEGFWRSYAEPPTVTVSRR